MTTTPPDCIEVSIDVLAVEPVAKGTLVAMASASLMFGGSDTGAEVIIQGIQVRRRPDGGLDVLAPTFRAPDGTWAPAVVLPEDLAGAVATAVAECLE